VINNNNSYKTKLHVVPVLTMDAVKTNKKSDKK